MCRNASTRVSWRSITCRQNRELPGPASRHRPRSSCRHVGPIGPRQSQRDAAPLEHIRSDRTRSSFLAAYRPLACLRQSVFAQRENALDVRAEVDHARDDEAAGDIEAGPAGNRPIPDRGDLAVAKPTFATRSTAAPRSSTRPPRRTRSWPVTVSPGGRAPIHRVCKGCLTRLWSTDPALGSARPPKSIQSWPRSFDRGLCCPPAVLAAVLTVGVGGPAIASTATGTLSVRVLVQPNGHGVEHHAGFRHRCQHPGGRAQRRRQLAYTNCPAGQLRFELAMATPTAP